MCLLLSLPIEVLHQIHLLSSSEYLPLVCKKLLQIYSNTTSDRYKVNYLWRKYLKQSSRKEKGNSSKRCKRVDGRIKLKSNRRWDRVLSNRACSIQVLKLLKRFVELELEEEERMMIQIKRIPTRLFKPLSVYSQNENSNQTNSNIDYSYEFIKLLLTEFNTCPNKLGGYPLARSVLSGNIKFIRLLLNHGAQPETKNYLAIKIAIQIKNLEILKLLIEINYIHPIEIPLNNTKNSHFHKNHSHHFKKFKFTDRVLVTDQMLEESVRRKDPFIFRYLLEKGAKPTLKTIQLIESMKIAWSFF